MGWFECFQKIVGFPPKSSNSNRFFPLFSPSILGYPYFWKHPTGLVAAGSTLTINGLTSTDDFIFLSSRLPAHKNRKLVVEVPSHEWKIWTNVKMVKKKKLLQINRDEKQKNCLKPPVMSQLDSLNVCDRWPKNDKIKKRQWEKLISLITVFPVFFTCSCKNHPPEEIGPGKILAGGAGGPTTGSVSRSHGPKCRHAEFQHPKIHGFSKRSS